MAAPVLIGLNLNSIAQGGYWVGLHIVADLNGDGRQDVVLGYTGTDPAAHAFPLRVLLSDGMNFRDATAEILGSNITVDGPGAYALADFNRDGKNDLFIANSGLDVEPFPGAASTLLLSGSGGLRQANLPGTKAFAHTTSYGDIDRDGDLDIYVGNIFSQGRVGSYFLVNDGAGNFTEDRSRLPGQITDLNANAFTGSAMADVDGDGDADLIVTGLGDASPSRVLLNDGGRFSTEILLPRGPNPSSRPDPVTHVLTTDLNGDGRVDLILNYAVDNYQGGYLQVLINQGGGNFADETALRMLTIPAVAATGDYRWYSQPELIDMNGDGLLDIVLGQGTTAPVLLNDGTGRFVSMPDALAVQNEAQHVIAGDFNGDGIGDVMVWHANSNGKEIITVTYGQRPEAVQNGDAGNNGLSGTKGDDALDAGGGQDVILGYAGDDRINGQDGNDRAYGGLGNDTVDGGAGTDYLRGDEGNDVIQGGAGADDIHGNMGNDTERGGDGDDWVVGGKDNDTLFGDDGFDIVYGNLGNDTCEGGAGNDWVRGGQGEDLVNGGTGDDLLWGDKGSDTITGGAGADRFNTHAEAGLDRVLDFNFAEGDRIRVEFGTYTVAAQGGDTILDFGGGNQMVLVGVTGFDSGWII